MNYGTSAIKFNDDMHCCFSDLALATFSGSVIGALLRYAERAEPSLICSLLGGPKFMLFWTRKGMKNAIQETHAGGDYRQAA